MAVSAAPRSHRTTASRVQIGSSAFGNRRRSHWHRHIRGARCRREASSRSRRRRLGRRTRCRTRDRNAVEGLPRPPPCPRHRCRHHRSCPRLPWYRRRPSHHRPPSRRHHQRLHQQPYPRFPSCPRPPSCPRQRCHRHHSCHRQRRATDTTHATDTRRATAGLPAAGTTKRDHHDEDRKPRPFSTSHAPVTEQEAFRTMSARIRLPQEHRPRDRAATATPVPGFRRHAERASRAGPGTVQRAVRRRSHPAVTHPSYPAFLTTRQPCGPFRTHHRTPSPNSQLPLTSVTACMTPSGALPSLTGPILTTRDRERRRTALPMAATSEVLNLKSGLTPSHPVSCHGGR